MENLGQKKKPCEEIIFSRQKCTHCTLICMIWRFAAIGSTTILFNQSGYKRVCIAFTQFRSDSLGLPSHYKFISIRKLK